MARLEILDHASRGTTKYVAKIKAIISCGITAQLICTFSTICKQKVFFTIRLKWDLSENNVSSIPIMFLEHSELFGQFYECNSDELGVISGIHDNHVILT